MKNLKRALSLVLSTAMLVGMMVVGTGAAELKDIKGHDNQEAAELMAMIGVMEGDGENFNPDKVVTRNEMAVVMTNLLDLKLNGAHPFTDVASWADKYVAAIYTNGYTAGKSATTFGGSDKITTAEAALMIMKTLGYFEFQGEFGSDWKLATIKQATKLELLENVEAGINEYLTRGEVAEMVMSALNLDVVVAEEFGGMSVEGNGITVTEKPTYVHTPVETLKAKLYDGTLTTNENAHDAFGRPATTWTYTGGEKASESITVADKADIVFTTAQDDDDITKALKDYGFGANENIYTDGFVNGSTVTKANLDTKTGNGVRVEIFADKQSQITDIVVINEYIGRVSSVTKADEEKGIERSVTLNVQGLNAYETEDFARKDYVRYTKAGNDIKSMVAAELVTGTIDAVASSYVKIDGVTYKPSANYNLSLNLKDEVEMYLDSYGFLLGVSDVIEAIAAVEDYVVVTADNGSDSFGAQMVKVIYADGTKATLTVDAVGTGIVAQPQAGSLYTIEKTDDGYEFTDAVTTQDPNNSNKTAGYDNFDNSGRNNKDNGTLNGWKIADDAVIFAYNSGNSKYSVLSGAQLKKLATDVVTSSSHIYANDAANGFATVELAYVTVTTTGALDDTAYGYVVDTVETVNNADDKAVYKITFWNGAENVTLLADENEGGSLVKGDFFSYQLNEDGELDSITEIRNYIRPVSAFDGKFIQVGGTYEITEDTVIIYVDTDKVVGVADGDIEIADKDDQDQYINNVLVTAANGEVVVLFVDINNKIVLKP